MTNYDLALLGGKVVTATATTEANIYLRQSKIAKVSPQIFPAERTLRVNGRLIFPGLVDPHCHLRHFEQSQKGTIRSETKAAVAGGYTHVFWVGNTSPSITSKEMLGKAIAEISKEAVCKVTPYLVVGDQNFSEAKELQHPYNKLFLGPSTSSLGISDEVFGEAVSSLPFVAVHPEDRNTLEQHKMEKNHCLARPYEAELSAVQMCVNQTSVNRMYLFHLTGKQSFDLIQNVPNVWGEVCPHHLFLDKENYDQLGNVAKMNPPLRSKAMKEQLWNALLSGMVMSVGTDHAPHTKAEKKEGAAGVPGFETALPLFLTQAAKGLLSYNRIVELMSHMPRKILSLPPNNVLPGDLADLTVVDPHHNWVCTVDKLETKNKWSPFEGWSFEGRVTATVVEGHLNTIADD